MYSEREKIIYDNFNWYHTIFRDFNWPKRRLSSECSFCVVNILILNCFPWQFQMQLKLIAVLNLLRITNSLNVYYLKSGGFVEPFQRFKFRPLFRKKEPKNWFFNVLALCLSCLESSRKLLCLFRFYISW